MVTGVGGRRMSQWGHDAILMVILSGWQSGLMIYCCRGLGCRRAVVVVVTCSCGGGGRGLGCGC